MLQKTILLLTLLFVMTGCPGDDVDFPYYIKLSNQSGEAVFYHKLGAVQDVYSSGFTASPMRSITSGMSTDTGFRDTEISGEKSLYLLLYKKSTLDNYTWEEIQQQNLHDARYKFSTIEELQSINFEIIYDGN